jgi:hypothetical protein
MGLATGIVGSVGRGCGVGKARDWGFIGRDHIWKGKAAEISEI